MQRKEMGTTILNIFCLVLSLDEQKATFSDELLVFSVTLNTKQIYLELVLSFSMFWIVRLVLIHTWLFLSSDEFQLFW